LYSLLICQDEFLNISLDNEKLCIFPCSSRTEFSIQIDVEKQEVTTIAGLGKPGTDKEGGKPGTQQELSSPWDVIIGPSPGDVYE
jgi:hypothetical protein